MRLVLASNNAKKLAELQALLAPAGVALVTQGSLGIPEADEPHASFIENALVKARQAARLSGGPAMADDSGLCVDALGGAPGVVSAHFAAVALVAGEREVQRAVQDAANSRLLLERLAPLADRRAHFIATLVALRSADDPEPLIAVGRWQGEILREPSGSGGFGYDPLMFIPALGASVAALGAEVKNAHSHRAIAARQMLGLLRDVWRLG
ncbi:MAG: non-canonical purine NTP pyrophosphatase [Bacteriovorax sp.]|nr:non-canonical purine NTP pyrophosphatase [Rhizobacter sp.]